MLSAALERAGWAEVVVLGRADVLGPRRVAVGAITLIAQPEPDAQTHLLVPLMRQLSRRSRRPQRHDLRADAQWFRNRLAKLQPQLVLAMDPSALAVCHEAVLSERGKGCRVELAYDRSLPVNHDSIDDHDERSAMPDVEIGLAASTGLAAGDRWPVRLRGHVPAVYPIPLDLAETAAVAAPLKRALKDKTRPRVGVFLPRALTRARLGQLARLIRVLDEGQPVVFAAPDQVRRVARALWRRRRRAHVEPLPDDDDVCEIVRLLDVVVCPSSWEPALPPTIPAIACAIQSGALVASRTVVAELATGHEVDDASVDAIARAIRTAGASRSRSTPRNAETPRPHLTYSHQAKIAGGGFGTQEQVKVKLGIGPRNGNGQAWAWAQALRRRRPELSVEAFAAQYQSTGILMTHECDISIPLKDWKRREWQRWWAHRLRMQYTHLLIEQGLAAAGPLKGSSFVNELPLLLDSGLHVALVFRGSEIRNPAGHAARERWSPFAEPSDPLTEKLQGISDVSRRALMTYGVPVFVTTLDLLDDVPNATWLPQALDLGMWAPGEAILQRPRPVILHAPSSTMLKGSHWVDEACQPLHDAGVIEYQHLRDVPFAEMPSRIRKADIVIDQLALGSYGVLALQAMACERMVIGHVSDRVRGRLGEPLPVLQAEPPDLRRVLENVLAEAEWARSFARRGREYVLRFHSGDESADRLLHRLMGMK